MPLTQNGYTKSTAREIKDKLINQIRLSIPEFTEQPADLQNDILDTSIEGILLYEDMMSELFNAYAPAFANKDIFRKFAESLGLRQKEEFKAQVTLTFSGKMGDLIPKGTIVCSETDESSVFTTQDNAVISSTNEVNVLALSETTSIFVAGTLTKLKSVLNDGVSVTNKSDSLGYIPAETEEQLTYRAQAKLRSARQGGKLYAVSCLSAISGVNPRLIAFYDSDGEQTINNQKMYVKGIEAVIGGGEDTEVALALYKSFLETQKLVSYPTNNETSRSSKVILYIYNNPVEVQFTRPKLVEISITLLLSLTDLLTSPTSLQALTESALTDYINNLQVGVPISKYALIDLLLPLIVDAGIPAYTITNISFKYHLGDVGEFVDFNSDGFIPEIERDCYASLVGYGVVING